MNLPGLMSVRQRDNKRLTASHRFSLSDLAMMEASADPERLRLDKTFSLGRSYNVKVRPGSPDYNNTYDGHSETSDNVQTEIFGECI